MRIDLILTMRDAYINSNLNPLTKALSLKISFYGTSEMILKSIPISMRIVISYTMKRGIPI